VRVTRGGFSAPRVTWAGGIPLSSSSESSSSSSEELSNSSKSSSSKSSGACQRDVWNKINIFLRFIYD